MRPIKPPINLRQNNFVDCDDLTAYAASISDNRCLLSFSCGKDAVAAWIQLKRYFKEIIPVYLYLVPGLSFVERSIKYYEEQFGTRIIQMPTPALYRMMGNYVFQKPSSRKAIKKLNIPEFDFDDVFRVVREDLDLPPTTYTAVGVRVNDSLTRRASVKRFGPINHKRKQFYPVYDWNKQRLIDEISAANLQLAEDYHVWGRSFDGLHYPFLKPLKDHYPEDYEKVKQLFPLCDLELKRFE